MRSTLTLMSPVTSIVRSITAGIAQRSCTPDKVEVNPNTCNRVREIKNPKA